MLRSAGSPQYSEASERPPRFFERLCGRFTVDEEQMQVLQEFSRSMRQCSLAFFLVSATNIVLTISQVCALSASSTSIPGAYTLNAFTPYLT